VYDFLPLTGVLGATDLTTDSIEVAGLSRENTNALAGHHVGADNVQNGLGVAPMHLIDDVRKPTWDYECQRHLDLANKLCRTRLLVELLLGEIRHDADNRNELEYTTR